MAKRNNRIARAIAPITQGSSQNTLSTRDKLLIDTLYTTGCTTSELTNLKQSDISQHQISLGQRKIPIPQKLAKSLKKLSAPYVFASRQNTKTSERRIQQLIKQNTGKTPKEIRQEYIKNKAKTTELEFVKQQAGIKHLTQRDYLSEVELNTLKSAITSERDQLIFSMLEKGLKVKELTSLEIKDIEKTQIKLENRSVSIKRTTSEKILRYALKNKRSKRIFSSRQSGTISEKRVFQILQNYEKKTGVRVNARLLRNSAISRLQKAGISEQIICEKFGLARLPFNKYGLL